MAQHIKHLSLKPDNLSLDPRTHIKARRSSIDIWPSDVLIRKDRRQQEFVGQPASMVCVAEVLSQETRWRLGPETQGQHSMAQTHLHSHTQSKGIIDNHGSDKSLIAR